MLLRLFILLITIPLGLDLYLPVPESVAIFRKALARAGNKNYVVKIYPNSNHSLLESDSGSPSTGGTEKNFPVDLWKTKTDWLLNQLSGKQ